MRSAPFPFQSAARTGEQHRHSRILDDRLTTLLGHALQCMRNMAQNGKSLCVDVCRAPRRGELACSLRQGCSLTRNVTFKPVSLGEPWPADINRFWYLAPCHLLTVYWVHAPDKGARESRLRLEHARRTTIETARLPGHSSDSTSPSRCEQHPGLIFSPTWPRHRHNAQTRPTATFLGLPKGSDLPRWAGLTGWLPHRTAHSLLPRASGHPLPLACQAVSALCLCVLQQR